MTTTPRKTLIGALSALFVVTGMGTAFPAGAATASDAAFYTGANQTGTATPVDPNGLGVCKNLTQSAKSAINVSSNDIDVFFNANCLPGAPGKQSDLHYALGSLHTANFPYAAVSYRARPAGS